MLSRVERYIAEHKLLDKSGLYLVALSGGADSTALLLLLRELGYSIEAVHCNFNLRGAEAVRDEEFCKALCRKHNVPFHRILFDTKAYAAAHHVSIELAARELRYTYFEQLRRDIGATDVCVAHHQDDVAETVLMNMARGTGLRGLTGIRPRNGHVVRPLLCVARHEIEHFLAERQQTFVDDSTNFEDDATRNVVRHHVVPQLQQVNAKATEHICQMAERMAAVRALVDNVLSPLKESRCIDLAELRRVVSHDYLLYEIIRQYGFNTEQARQMFLALGGGSDGGLLFSSDTHDILIDRGKLIVEEKTPDFNAVVMPEDGLYVVSQNVPQKGRIKVSTTERSVSFEPSKKPYTATLDADKLTFPLTLRRAEAGDWMVPYGMHGRQLLGDMMTNRKFTFFERRRQLVVVNGDGRIVWLVGLRTDQRFCVDETSSRITTLQISFEQ